MDGFKRLFSKNVRQARVPSALSVDGEEKRIASRVLKQY